MDGLLDRVMAQRELNRPNGSGTAIGKHIHDHIASSKSEISAVEAVSPTSFMERSSWVLNDGRIIQNTGSHATAIRGALGRAGISKVEKRDKDTGEWVEMQPHEVMEWGSGAAGLMRLKQAARDRYTGFGTYHDPREHPDQMSAIKDLTDMATDRGVPVAHEIATGEGPITFHNIEGQGAHRNPHPKYEQTLSGFTPKFARGSVRINGNTLAEDYEPQVMKSIRVVFLVRTPR